MAVGVAFRRCLFSRFLWRCQRIQIQSKTPDCAEWFQHGLQCPGVVLLWALGAPGLSQGSLCSLFLPVALLNPFLCSNERGHLAELPATSGVQERRMRLKSRAGVPRVCRGIRAAWQQGLEEHGR